MTAVRWLLLVGPARLYMRGEETGGKLPYLYLLVALAIAMLGATAGGVYALCVGLALRGGIGYGVMAGMLALAAWSVYALAVLLVLWIRKRSIAEVAGDEWMDRPRRWWDR